MSLLTTVQEATPGNYYFQLDNGTTGALPAGIASNLTWAAGPAGSGTYFATIPVPGATPSTIFTVTASTAQSNITDALNCWIVTSYGSALAGGGLLVYVAANPASTANFKISWAVLQL
jgi:hypothetical protein